jgi:hypothetical protein
MPSPADTLAVRGVTWLKAMESAVEILEKVDQYTNRKMLSNPEWMTANCAVAQGWMALAREITMHSRATQ